MSYMRMGYPLKYFKKGETESYVFNSVPTRKHKESFIEDYDDDYKDNKSFCELIGGFVLKITGNKKYAWKIVKILAKKLKVDKDLRKRPLTIEQEIELTFKRINGKEIKKKNLKNG